jgi:hypothetical protein
MLGKNIRKKLVSPVLLVLLGIMVFSMFCNVPEVAAQTGYSSAFEGPKARFFGVDYAPTHAILSATNQDYDGEVDPPGLGNHFLYASADDGSMLYDNSMASRKTFDTTMDFDGDSSDANAPNLKGSMTSIYLPKDTLSSGVSWLPFSWLTRDQYVSNPMGDMINWTIGDTQYGMQKWLCHYSIALGAEWQGDVSFWGVSGEIPPPGLGDNSYEDLDVWVKIDTSPTSYYKNAQNTYFAIGKIQLADSIYYKGTSMKSGGLFDSNVVEPRTVVSINPEGQGGLIYLYDTAFGGAYKTENNEYSYQGQALNPQYFKDTSYFKISLNKFGVYSGANFFAGLPIVGSLWAKGDVAKITFDVIVFSIGEWKVQDIQDDPSGFGYFVKEDTSPSDFFTWLLSPATLAWLIPVAIFVVVLFFAPWVIILLVSIFRGR